MPAVFVTATGTEIGKTYVTAGLARCLRGRGRKVAILKPIVSGFEEQDWQASDPAILLEALGETPSLAAINSIAPWRFKAPLSPDMAAAQEGKTIDFAALVSFCRNALASAEDVLLIEGIGGVMVPLTAEASVLDLLEALDIAPILVAGTYVGTLSHTLTALEAIERRGINLCALVLNETPGSVAALEATAASLQHFYKAGPIVILKRDAANANTAGFEILADRLQQSWQNP
jgi:dethiobiotin synthetase